MGEKLVIPNPDSLLQTSHEDIKHFYYHKFWPIRYLYRKRLALGLDALGKKKCNNMLELGTGGGFLLYSLTKKARKIVASDIHPHLKKVEKNLKKDGIKNVKYQKIDINKVPYKECTFDIVVAMSVLEHIKRLDNAVSEIKRVLTKGGKAVIGIPAENLVMKIGFNLIGAGEDVKHHHCNNHKGIIKAFKKQMKVTKIKRFPIPYLCTMYYIITCEK